MFPALPFEMLSLSKVLLAEQLLSGIEGLLHLLQAAVQVVAGSVSFVTVGTEAEIVKC